MSRPLRPFCAVLLGLLLLAWGPCPGLWAQTLGAVAGPERGEAPEACCCGCETPAPTPTPEPDRPLDEDCPFCGVFGGRGAALDAPVGVSFEPPVPGAFLRPEAPGVLAPAPPIRRTPDDHAGPPRRDGPLGTVVLLI